MEVVAAHKRGRYLGGGLASIPDAVSSARVAASLLSARARDQALRTVSANPNPLWNAFHAASPTPAAALLEATSLNIHTRVKGLLMSAVA